MLRQKNGMPLKMLADRLGITQQQLMRYESGKALFSYNLLFRMAQALQVSTTDILEGPTYFTPECIELESQHSCVYEQKLSRVSLRAFLADSISDSSVCSAESSFCQIFLGQFAITIPESVLVSIVFSNHHNEIADRKFISKNGQNECHVCFQREGFAISFLTSDEEAYQLCYLFDHFYDFYTKKTDK